MSENNESFDSKDETQEVNRTFGNPDNSIHLSGGLALPKGTSGLNLPNKDSDS